MRDDQKGNGGSFRSLVVTAIILMVTTCPTWAQYKVLSVVGTVEVRGAAAKTFEQTKPGAIILAGSTVRVGQKGYIAMIDPNGRPFERRRAGDTVLPQPRTSAATDVGERIGGFLMEAVTKGPVKGEYVGSVYRGDTDRSTSVVFPFDTKVLLGPVTLVWKHKAATSTRYRLRFMNDVKAVLAEYEVADTIWSGDLAKIDGVRRGQCVYWSVAPVGGSEHATKPLCLLFVDEQEAQETLAADSSYRNQERGVYDPETSAVAALFIAAWYQERGYLSEALRYYDQAIRLQPGSEEFRIARDRVMASISN